MDIIVAVDMTAFKSGPNDNLSNAPCEENPQSGSSDSEVGILQ